MLIVSTWMPHKITIDGEEVELRIKRMSVEEDIDFNGRARINSEQTFMRYVSRGTTAEEQETDEKGNFKLSLAQIFERHFQAFTPEKRAEFTAAVAADELKAQEFLKYTFSNFVRVAAGLIEQLEDGTQQTISEGIDVLRLFGARNDVLSEIVKAVRELNVLSPKKKEISKSGSASTVSSSELGPDPGGPKPETIVESAETEGSAKIEDATPAPAAMVREAT